jgi:hypothetical protein
MLIEGYHVSYFIPILYINYHKFTSSRPHTPSHPYSALIHPLTAMHTLSLDLIPLLSYTCTDPSPHSDAHTKSRPYTPTLIHLHWSPPPLTAMHTLSLDLIPLLSYTCTDPPPHSTNYAGSPFQTLAVWPNKILHLSAHRTYYLLWSEVGPSHHSEES